MVYREIFVGKEIIPDVGRLRARAARKAKLVKKVSCSSEVVWDRRWRVATCIASAEGVIGVCFARGRVGMLWEGLTTGLIARGGGGRGELLFEEEEAEVEVEAVGSEGGILQHLQWTK